MSANASSLSADPSSLESKVRAFVGPKAEYYLAEWQRYITGESRGARFNAAGLFFSAFWLAYRKMGRAFALLIAAVSLETLLEDLVFLKLAGLPDPPRAMTSLVALVVGLVVGRFGNYWYYRQFERALARVETLTRDPTEQLRMLQRRGGTSLWVMLAWIFLALLVSIPVYVFLSALLGIPEP